MKSIAAKSLYAFICASLLTALLGVRPAHAASITVNSNGDTVGDQGLCTLREAIIAANTNTPSGGLGGECAAGSAIATDVITLTSGVTYSLTRNSTNEDASFNGDLDIIDNAGVGLDLRIVVSGATNAIISQDAAPTDDRVFDVLSGATVEMTNLTITNGSITGNGGGIRNNGTLTITNSTLSGNSATGSGGGIDNFGTLTINNSTLSGNSATGSGGGIDNFGTLTITNSTLSSNSTTTFGGGIFNLGTLTITNSTLSGNSAFDSGGGIRNDGTLTITNSTFFGNSASQGGGIDNRDTLTLTNGTFSSNSASSNGGGIFNRSTLTITNGTFSGNSASVGNGGGLFNSPIGTLNFANTIIANSSNNAIDCQNAGAIGTNTNNLVQDNSCSPSLSGDPRLGLLANNGGPTQTMALLTSPILSPAINAGANCPATDQRGISRPQGLGCDIGAFELVLPPTPTPPPSPTPTTTPLPVPVTGGSALPNTGFAPNRLSSLPDQPASLAYTALGDLWLEIPALQVKTSIVGIPKSNNKWNVDWLGKDAGWLNGTAFPSWEGNSVLTGHVYDANGLSGPFANLKDLKYGDQIIVHMYGEKYIFEIREVRTVRPASTRYALKHLEDYSYLTLITCQYYDEKTNTYAYRRVVRAVLVKVQSE